jgi:hypothetical protein
MLSPNLVNAMNYVYRGSAIATSHWLLHTMQNTILISCNLTMDNLNKCESSAHEQGSDVLCELEKEPFSLWDHFRALYTTYASYIYRVFQEERSIFWEVIVSVILSNIVYAYVSYSERFPRYYFTVNTWHNSKPWNSSKLYLRTYLPPHRTPMLFSYKGISVNTV